MTETHFFASFPSHGSAQRPYLTETAIDDLGLNLLATGGPSPALDLILVHGLQGHPEHTWTHIRKVKHGSSKKEASVSKLKFWKSKAEEATSSADKEPARGKDDNVTYWPTKLLAPDLPTARIFTYGYDSRVSHFFNGPVNENTITDNGRALLSSIASQRQDCHGRPMLLIVHSLGGIVVKSALRISALADDVDADLRDIYQSTFAILFFGTPHRGSDWTDAGQIARKFAAVLGFSTTDYNLRALQGNTEILEILRDEFARMLGKEAFYITSFQESKGFKGVKGLDAKIVEPDSSGIEHLFERKIPINANHLDMCKFGIQGPTRREYDEKVRSEIIRHWRREFKRLHELQKTLELNATKGISNECETLLESLDPDSTSRRFYQVEQAYSQTFEWLFTKPELGFKSWLESGKGLYWCRGHPGSGKSTLMKWAYTDTRTIEALASGEMRKVKASFFFHDRGSEIQKSFKGLLQGITYQILRDIPELLQLIIPIHQQISKRLDSNWTQEDIHKAFQVLLKQQNFRLSVTLFLDALDEYDGTHENIASFLYSIATMTETALTEIKICFSSRPLQIFLDKFNDEPGFSIHEHTTEDIRMVIQSRMSQNRAMFQCMKEATPRYRLLATEFAKEVILRAEGIFLWVKLVLDELLDEFTAGETIQGLIRKLMCLPPKLEDFYQHTLDRLPSRYHDDTKVIFEVLGCAIEPLRLHDVFEICRYTKIERLVGCTPCTAMDDEWSDDSAQRWIRSRTGGLVQFVPISERHVYFEGEHWEGFICPTQCRLGKVTYAVQFLHQSVKTFTQEARWATLSTSDRFPCHNGYAYIARYVLTLLYQHCDASIKGRWDRSDDEDSSLQKQYFWPRFGAYYLLDPLLSYISFAESRIPKALLSSLLEVGDDKISDLFHNIIWIEMDHKPLTCISAVAVVLDLCDLLEEILMQENAQNIISSPPLLHLAFSRLTYRQFKIDSKKRSRSIQILLDHGADSSEIFEGCTPYQRLCTFAVEAILRPDNQEGSALLRMVKPFLQKGQDPNVMFQYKERGVKRKNCLVQRSLLHYAAETADCELIFALIEYGANVNVIDNFGSTPLDCVCDGPRTISSVNPQLSELVDNLVQERSGNQSVQHLRRRIQAALLLISRGGRFGIPPADTDDEFLVKRRPITMDHVHSMRSYGIDVDDRIVWCPQNQIKPETPGFIWNPFNFLKRHVAS